MEDIARIANGNFVPIEEDILRLNSKNSIVDDIRLPVTEPPSRGRVLSLLNVRDQSTGLRKVVSFLEGAFAIVYVVDLASYDHIQEDSGLNELKEALVHYDSIAKSKWFKKTPVIFILNNQDIFRHQLQQSPLESFFPGYNGGNDEKRATEYILKRFLEVNPSNLEMYSRFLQAYDKDPRTLITDCVFNMFNRRREDNMSLIQLVNY